MKREVAANTSVFPQSMSDFKPAALRLSFARNTNVRIGTAVLCYVEFSGFAYVNFPETYAVFRFLNVMS